MSKKKEQSFLMGIGVYRREQWPLLRALAVDSQDLEPQYDLWFKALTEFKVQLQSMGHASTEVDIDVNELLAWCEAQNRPLDAQARTEFIEIKVRNMQGIE